MIQKIIVAVEENNILGTIFHPEINTFNNDQIYVMLIILIYIGINILLEKYINQILIILNIILIN